MDLITLDIDDTLVLSGGVDDVAFAAAISRVVGDGQFNPDWDSYRQETEPAIAAEILALCLRREPTVGELTPAESNYLEELRGAAAGARDCFRCMSGAPELVAFLCNEPSFAVAFATAGWRSTASFKLASAGIKADGIPLASGDDASSKTEVVVSARAKARRHYGVESFSSHTHIGDRPSDQRAATEIGCKFVAIARDKAKASAFGERETVHLFSDLAPMARLVQIFRE